MGKESGQFKFLQFSDVHLDSRLSFLKLPLSLTERQQRRREILEVFLLALEVARSEQIDAVLIPGDLWHNETIKGATLARIINGCAELGDIPVVIAPGDSDYYSDESFYNNEILHLYGLPTWSNNVHIFKGGDFSTVKHPSYPHVAFTGRALLDSTPQADHPLANLIPRDLDAEINILLLCGSIEGYTGVDKANEAAPFSPFTAEQLEENQFTYAALGHYQDYTEVLSGAGDILGAYSGSLAGRGFDELGPRFALFGTIQKNEFDAWQCNIEPLELDRRRMVMVSADISGLTGEEMLEEITMSIADQGGRIESDLVFLQLEGNYRIDTNPTEIIEELHYRYYNVAVMDYTRPDYLSETFDERTTEAKFVESLLAMKKNAENLGVESDTTQNDASLIEDALYYGLDALRRKRVTVRDVD
ncbi:MAG TPA: metallophosphoesterase [Drouetiella sp.]